MSFFSINKNCNGCLACVRNCPAKALTFKDNESKRTLLHNMSLCARCGNCWRICPQQAIEFHKLLQGDWDEVTTMELVNCIVCGEPLYTNSFGRQLAQKLDYNIEALCPLHRKALSLKAWSHLAPESPLNERGSK